MKLQQLSIFAENKHGALYNITSLLKKANIDIHAFSVADTSNFGVLRLIVSDIRGACKVLSEADIVVNITEVVGVEIPDVPGGLANVLEVLFYNSIGVEYMYAFVSPLSIDKAYVVLRVQNNDKAEKVLADAGFKLIDDTMFAQF